MASQAQTGQYLGIRLTVQCDLPQDPYYAAKDFFPSEGAEGIRVGRTKDCDIFLQDAGVSGLHCRLKSGPQGFWLEDMGSRNGTYLGGRLLEPDEQVILQDGDVIDLHPYRITVHLGASVFQKPAPPSDGMDSTRDLGKQMLQSMLTGEESATPTLQWLNAPQGPQSFALKEYEDFTIGRSDQSSLFLNDEAISREHAIIRRDWTGVTIRDLESRNGVVVNGVMVRRGSEVELKHNDRIVLGSHQFVFRDPFAAEMAQKLNALPVHLRSDDDSTLPPTAMTTGAFASLAAGDEPTSGQWQAPKRSAPSPSFVPPPKRSIPPPTTTPPVAPVPAKMPVASPPPMAVMAPSSPPSTSALPSSQSPAPAPVAALRPAQQVFLWIGGFLLALLLGILGFLLFLYP
ncbi:FHA domain-containing protein [Myxococcota bacterium]|nr:FHA domain-containing protein [Myxococcota bacterium]